MTERGERTETPSNLVLLKSSIVLHRILPGRVLWVSAPMHLFILRRRGLYFIHMMSLFLFSCAIRISAGTIYRDITRGYTVGESRHTRKWRQPKEQELFHFQGTYWVYYYLLVLLFGVYI